MIYLGLLTILILCETCNVRIFLFSGFEPRQILATANHVSYLCSTSFLAVIIFEYTLKFVSKSSSKKVRIFQLTVLFLHFLTSCFLLQQKSLSSYMKRYAWKNAKTEDLWAILSEESGVEISSLMHSWTKQKGYPLISVKFKDHILEFDQVLLLYFLYNYPCLRKLH